MIEPSTSPWSAQAVLASKKDGSYRYCVDFRRLNSVTVKEHYPVPRVEDMIDTLAGAKCFSALDLISAYHAFEIHPEDREKTAFSTKQGHWQWKRVPFGLCNAAPFFVRQIVSLLAGMTWEELLAFFDDVLVLSPTFAKHCESLDRALTLIGEAGLKVKPEKCRVLPQCVPFLGHILSPQGVSTDPEKVSAVKSWPPPPVVVDMYTKWPEAYALPNQEADTVTQAVMDNFVCRFGCPHGELSDQGRNFESRFFRGLCDLIESVKQKTTPYHPQCDGGAERLIRTVTSVISKIAEEQEEWDQHLPKVLLALRASTHETTGFSPSMLMFGREMRLPIDAMREAPPLEESPEYPLFVKKQREILKGVQDRVEKNLEASLRHQKDVYDARCKRDFHANDSTGGIYFHTNSSHKESFCHRGKSKLGIGLVIHELLREPLI